jgi:D-methionine transport system permease protein
MFDITLDTLDLVLLPLWQTIYMTFWTLIFGIIFGAPIGILLNITSNNNILPKPKLNKILGVIVNIFRSFPFLILMILVFPLSRLIVGVSIGTTACIVPLSIASAPFIARVVETALLEVDTELIKAAKIMGSTNWQIVYKVLIPEALPSIVSGLTLTTIAVISNTAMAGAIGGGGLGDLAIRYGYHRYRTDILIVAVIVIIALVSSVQITGSKIVKKIIEKR